jgi:hypothetical protein
MDRLEEFINNNRADFDNAVPGLRVWARLDKALDQQQAQHSRPWKAMRAAAAVLLLLAAGGIGGHYLGRMQATAAVAKVETISPEAAEAERYYNEQFQEKYQQLAKYTTLNTLEPDFDQIDQATQELKQELLNVPKGSEEQVVRNLIQNYQLKLQILEHVLERVQAVQPTQNVKSQDNETGI